METGTIQLSPNELKEILNKHFGVKDTRIFSCTTADGYGWDCIRLVVYDKKVPNKVQKLKSYSKF